MAYRAFFFFRFKSSPPESIYLVMSINNTINDRVVQLTAIPLLTLKRESSRVSEF